MSGIPDLQPTSEAIVHSEEKAISEDPELTHPGRDIGVGNNDEWDDKSDDITRPNFTSEIYKIRIDNVNSNAAHSQISKKLISLNLKPKKVKKMKWKCYAYVTFASEEDRSTAIKALEGLEWRGKLLAVKNADATQDPMIQQKREAENQGAESAKRIKLSVEEYENKMLDKTTPYWREPYEEQLKAKQASMTQIMKRLKNDVESALRDSLTLKKDYGDLNFTEKLQEIKPSPQVDGYRNKCEFTVGKHASTEETTVGFRLGEYKQGTVLVMPPDKCKNVSGDMKKVVHVFESFVKNSKWKAFDPVTQLGHWQWLLVRTTTSQDMLIMPTFVRQQMTEDELGEVQNELKHLFVDGEGKECGITSLYIHIVPVQQTSDRSSNLPKCIHGKEIIEQTLLSLRFNISPSAFFQVNSSGAEVLYSTIADWAGITKDTLVYDVCCGTGTIGMIVSKFAKKVVGVDIESKAIEDAKQNAKMNGITNVEFKCGKAEDVMPNTLTSCPEEEIVAIVDPPRAGLHAKVALALRRSTALKKLVYVSCEPKSALKNFVELMRPVSKKFKGVPFRLEKAVPVDMFPHTDKCELVLLFTRELNE